MEVLFRNLVLKITWSLSKNRGDVLRPFERIARGLSGPDG